LLADSKDNRVGEERRMENVFVVGEKVLRDTREILTGEEGGVKKSVIYKQKSARWY
jgi:hypothetical protein